MFLERQVDERHPYGGLIRIWIEVLVLHALFPQGQQDQVALGPFDALAIDDGVAAPVDHVYDQAALMPVLARGSAYLMREHHPVLQGSVLDGEAQVGAKATLSRELLRGV